METEPEFDWSTAKPGMAFWDNCNDKFWYYYAPNYDEPNQVLCCNAGNIEDSSVWSTDLNFILKENLTRTPEHDKLDWMEKGDKQCK